jgi:hypothetical protein
MTDQARVKIIKDTVRNSILAEMENQLGNRLSDEEKAKEMMELTRASLNSILNALHEDELLPKREFASQQDFENHILEIVRKVRKKLLNEIEKES